jgi:hypothetical protein
VLVTTRAGSGARMGVWLLVLTTTAVCGATGGGLAIPATRLALGAFAAGVHCLLCAQERFHFTLSRVLAVLTHTLCLLAHAMMEIGKRCWARGRGAIIEITLATALHA